MSKELITTIRAFATVLSFSGAIVALLSGDTNVSIVLLVIATVLFSITLGENK